MNVKSSIAAVVLAGAVAGAVPALAHHSFAMYDNSKTVVLDGVVREFRWANPHGEVLLVITRNGRPVVYTVELSSLNVMSRQGWNRRSLVAGERVKISVHPLRDGSDGGSFAGAVKADGTVLRSPAPQ